MYIINAIVPKTPPATNNSPIILIAAPLLTLVITYLLTVAIFLIVSYLFKYIEIVFFNNIHTKRKETQPTIFSHAGNRIASVIVPIRRNLNIQLFIIFKLFIGIYGKLLL